MDKNNVDDLLKECIKMSEFDHPNVLTLIGVCLDGGPTPYIVMPFMENGSLLSYLKKERTHLVLEPGTTEDVVSSINSTVSCRINFYHGQLLFCMHAGTPNTKTPRHLFTSVQGNGVPCK